MTNMTDAYAELLGSSFLTAIGTVPTLVSILTYVLTALGLYTIASRRGIRKPWLAWIPVINLWILGSLSDQYRYVVRGEIRSKRKWLLGLGIAGAVLEAVMVGLAVAFFISAVVSSIRNVPEAYYLDRFMSQLAGIFLLAVPMLGVGIAKLVLYYMSLYDLYTSCDPQNNVLFLVLSILFGITRPFFIFCSREKDMGMPPRRPTPQPEPTTWNDQPNYL